MLTFDAEYPTEAHAWKAQFPEWVLWDMLCTCIWKSFAGLGGWHGGTVAPWSLCCVSYPWAEQLVSSYTLWHCYLAPYKRSTPTHPQLYPVVDWYLRNWARLNLFFIVIAYPTPFYFGSKILVCSLGWPWTPPYPSVSASKRAGISDIHHRVFPLRKLRIPGFLLQCWEASLTNMVLYSSS